MAVAVLMIETELPIPMTVDNTVAIPKGTVLKLSDLGVVSASTGADEAFGGIAAEEKVANDGKTTLSVYFGGVFKMTVGTNGCTVAFNVVIDDAANTITDKTDDGDVAEGLVVGKSFETGTAAETVLVFVGKY